MFKKLSLAFLCIGFLVSVCAEDNEDHDHADHGAWILDPYHEVLGFLNVSDENDFTVDKLDDLIEHLNERLQCDDHEDEHEYHEDEHNHEEHVADDGETHVCNETIVSVSS